LNIQLKTGIISAYGKLPTPAVNNYPMRIIANNPNIQIDPTSSMVNRMSETILKIDGLKCMRLKMAVEKVLKRSAWSHQCPSGSV
jgi:hypothetical protein